MHVTGLLSGLSGLSDVECLQPRPRRPLIWSRHRGDSDGTSETSYPSTAFFPDWLSLAEIQTILCVGRLTMADGMNTVAIFIDSSPLQ
jgi:hypothetical protein